MKKQPAVKKARAVKRAGETKAHEAKGGQYRPSTLPPAGAKLELPSGRELSLVGASDLSTSRGGTTVRITAVLEPFIAEVGGMMGASPREAAAEVMVVGMLALTGRTEELAKAVKAVALRCELHRLKTTGEGVNPEVGL